MAKRADVKRAFERLKALTECPDLELIYNSAWKGYNIERPFNANEPTRETNPFGLTLLTGDQIVSSVRFIEGYKRLKG
jgi:hypothetical protein